MNISWNFSVINSNSTTTVMKTMFQKHLILESLSGLDQTQTEQVLQYIRRLSQSRRAERDYEVASKREAMQQIRQALRSQKGVRPR